MSWRLLNKLSAIGVSSLGGISLYCFLNPSESRFKKVYNSWSSNVKPTAEWDANWDHRATTSIVGSKPKDPTPEKENLYNEKFEKNRSKATRHIILIRHGQYNLNGETDKERMLTSLGRQQAKLTGQRLAELNIPINEVIISTMTRAQETGNLILEQFSKDKLKSIEVKHEPLIEEGAPIEPGKKNFLPTKNRSLIFFFSSERCALDTGSVRIFPRRRQDRSWFSCSHSPSRFISGERILFAPRLPWKRHSILCLPCSPISTRGLAPL